MTTRTIARWRLARLLGPNFAVGALALAGVMALGKPAHAQLDPGRAAHPQVEQSQEKAVTPRPPPALPGSKPTEDTVIPADRAAGDMAPNEALFDAINRGDVGAAKDALNRGAELDAHNVLGQTPIDLSIDIGRNDISFLLLSMRGGGHGVGAPPAAPPHTAQAPAPARVARAPREAAVPVRAAPAAQAPQLFAGNGGAPVPQAGFLGFGSAVVGSGRTP